MQQLKIDTRASLYEAIEIEIDGQAFQVLRLNRDRIESIELLDQRVAAGELPAAYDRLELFLGEGAREPVKRLSVSEIIRITQFIVGALFKADQKNEPGPGAGK